GMPADGIGIRRCPAGIDLHISADGPAKRLQPLQEGSEPCLVVRIVRRCGEEHADAPHPLALLRARRERPRRSAAGDRDELTPFQLIELHSFPASQRHVTGYRIASDQSAAMLEFCNTLGSAYAGGRPPTTHSAR